MSRDEILPPFRLQNCQNLTSVLHGKVTALSHVVRPANAIGPVEHELVARNIDLVARLHDLNALDLPETRTRYTRDRNGEPEMRYRHTPGSTGQSRSTFENICEGHPTNTDPFAEFKQCRCAKPNRESNTEGAKNGLAPGEICRDQCDDSRKQECHLESPERARQIRTFPRQ